MSNPIIRLHETPVESLADAGWALFLLAALVVTWWALGRNVLYLREEYQNGWKYLVPFWYTLRTAGVFAIVAVDLWLLSAIVHIIG
jgi:hypothetical protein